MFVEKRGDGNPVADGRVAGVRCKRYQALVTAMDILASRARSKMVKAPPSAP